MSQKLTLQLDHKEAVSIAAEVIRDCIKTDAWMRAVGMVDETDRSNLMLEQALDYFAGDGTVARSANDSNDFNRGYEAGALAGDASDIGLIGYQLGRREERERCAWLCQQMADELSDPAWTLACHALADRIRGRG